MKPMRVDVKIGSVLVAYSATPLVIDSSLSSSLFDDLTTATAKRSTRSSHAIDVIVVLSP